MLTRRVFLSTAAGAAAASGLRAASGRGGKALVVVQLAGGNDGLNTVVPYEDDAWARARSTLRLKPGELLKVGSGLGFHPELRGFHRLLEQGRLAVVQGVGYPEMNRDHDRAMRNWQSAEPSAGRQQAGWLGRLADRLADPETGDVPAVFVGRIPEPLTIRTREYVVPCVHSAEEWMPAAGAVLPTSSAAVEDTRRVAAAVRSGGFEYPQYGLAQSLRSVAQLMRSELGIRVYLTELGGMSPGSFDNHSNQAGNHAVLLRELSDSVAAFCDDLARDGLLDRTLLVTFSEFGRTLTENGRHGTGHGAAAPVFAAGGKVKAGLIGKHPSLADLDNDAPRPHTDFRSVYATALERWLGVESAPVLGRKWPLVEMV